MNIVANVHLVRIADGSFKFFAIHFVILIWMEFNASRCPQPTQRYKNNLPYRIIN
jgi:hypothetical protein